ncbi:hypothetical protein M432DRAFT_590365 [Thermoascus aurantiacus ATCC 26904]
MTSKIQFAVEAICSSLQCSLADKIDKIATEAKRGQLLNQTDSHDWHSYIANTSALSSMDIFLEEQMYQDHIKYLQEIDKYCKKEYLTHLPAERQDAILHNPVLLNLEQQLQKLTLEKADSFEVSIIKKRIQMQKYCSHTGT